MYFIAASLSGWSRIRRTGSGEIDTGEGKALASCGARRLPPGKEEGATRAPHASEPMTQPGDAPQPGDGEGQNRTGDTTIFSRGSWCNCRARPEATGEDLPANRIYRNYRDLWSVIA